MSTMPRILAIMGSGETAPAMAKVHRALIARLAGGTSSAAGAAGAAGAAAVPAVIVDTPYGFQENADELSTRTAEFFATSVGTPVAVASYRSRDLGPVAEATALARIGSASFVMAGPGSPSYALRQWAGGPIPDALAGLLERGGVLVMASAAALTLGAVTIPVYEIYKVGEEPRWLPGLDILGRATGLHAAIVPHYDNAEGGSHDTRFCYMGERRLRALEATLPDGAFILGVDSHTALVLDLEAGSASVSGLGGVTVRVAGRSVRFPAGMSISIGALGQAAHALADGATEADVLAGAAAPSGTPSGTRADGASRGGGAGVAGVAVVAAPTRQVMQELEGAFSAALLADDVPAAVTALLDLEAAVTARIRSGEDSPDLDNAASVLRALVVRLGDRAAAAAGAGGTTAATAGGLPAGADLGPLLALVLDWRAAARTARDWPAADRIRDALAAAGIEVRDTPSGPEWSAVGGPMARS